MLSTSVDKQNLIFAQMLNSSENFSFTIPLEEFNTDQSSPNSSFNTDDSNVNEVFNDLSGSNADSFGAGTFEEQQETTVFEEQDDTATTEEQDDTHDDTATNPILEQIRNQVNETLSASGLTGP
jgi:hypothetical protein